MDNNQSIPITRTVKDDRFLFGSAFQDFRFSSAVEEFGLLLRDSKFKGQANFDQVLELASAAQGEDREGYRGEFI